MTRFGFPSIYRRIINLAYKHLILSSDLEHSCSINGLKQIDLTGIVQRSGSIIGLEMSETGAREIAKRSRGTPRIANRLLRRVRDYAEVKGDGSIDQDIAEKALDMLNVDVLGFDHQDRRLLLAIIERFNGGPVGVDTLSTVVGEERDTLEDVYEPYLVQEGYLNRTSRGRMATRLAYEHFNLSPSQQVQQQAELFDQEKSES